MESSMRAVVSLSFLVLAVPAVYTTWVILLKNPAAEIPPPPKSNPPLVPGTSGPLLQTFTGVAPIDEQLVTLFYFFWNAVNGTAPGLSLFMVGFVGDLASVYVLLVLEGLRPCNSGRLISYATAVGLIFQNITYALTMPLFVALYFWTSPIVGPTHPASVLPDAISTLCIPPALLCGLVAPSILAALPAPAIVTYNQKQLLMALWQPFPLWVGSAHFGLRRILLSVLPKSTVQQLRAQPRATLRAVYTFVLGVSLALRLGALSLSAAATVLPDLFKTEYAGELALTKILMPVTALHTTPVSSLASAVLLFLQWDMTIGSGAVLAWAAILVATANRAAGNVVTPLTLLTGVVSGTILLGSVGCAVALMWARDEIILSQGGPKKATESNAKRR